MELTTYEVYLERMKANHPHLDPYPEDLWNELRDQMPYDGTPLYRQEYGP